jgi:uncharacterized protein
LGSDFHASLSGVPPQWTNDAKRATIHTGMTPSTSLSTAAALPADTKLRLAPICERHRVLRLALFGSRAKGLGRADSDVDLLVAFEPGTTVTLLDMARLEFELASALGAGFRVDLRTAGDLSGHFRDEVVRTARPLYPA